MIRRSFIFLAICFWSFNVFDEFDERLLSSYGGMSFSLTFICKHMICWNFPSPAETSYYCFTRMTATRTRKVDDLIRFQIRPWVRSCDSESLCNLPSTSTPASLMKKALTAICYLSSKKVYRHLLWHSYGLLEKLEEPLFPFVVNEASESSFLPVLSPFYKACDAHCRNQDCCN